MSFMIPPDPIPLDKLGETPWCIEYRFSSNNLRDREFELTPSPGMVRIAGIGDSFAFGEGVPFDLSLFQQLESRLGSQVEILNAARPGFNTRQELDTLSKFRPYFHCHRALVVFVPNDVELTPELDQRQTFINDLINVRDTYLEEHESGLWYTTNQYAKQSRLIRFVASRLEMRKIERETIQWYLDSYDPRFNQDNIDWMAEYFNGFAALPDCRVALVLYPLMESLESDYPFVSIHELVSKMAKAAGLPVLDLAPVFSGRNTVSLQAHPTDHHPNGKAHALAADAIATWLREDVSGFLKLTPEEAAAAVGTNSPEGASAEVLSP